MEEESHYSSDEFVLTVYPRCFRPTGVDTLLGDPKEAKKNLVGHRDSNSKSLWPKMVLKEFKSAERNKLIVRFGYKPMDSTI